MKAFTVTLTANNLEIFQDAIAECLYRYGLRHRKERKEKALVLPSELEKVIGLQGQCSFEIDDIEFYIDFRKKRERPKIGVV